MKNIYTLLLVLCTATSFFAQQQTHFCGTPEGRSEWLQDFQRRADKTPRTDDELWVPIQIHVVGTDTGTGYYNLNRVHQDFCELQEQFAPSNIRLYLSDEINYVNSSQLYYHETFDEGFEVMDAISQPDIVNVYISREAAGNCGYAAYWANTVVLAHNCIGTGSSTWAHEMGHVFSLPHTFNNNTYDPQDDFNIPAPNDFERVDGSNCADAGDGFCDTPPDYLGFRWTCNDEDLSGRAQLDPDGVEFRSEGQYYMSYANDICMSRFSEEQKTAMRAFIQEERPAYLEYTASFEAITATDLTTVSPVDGGELVKNINQTLHWNQIEHADEYIVEVTRFEIFSFIEFKGTTKKNFFRIDGNLIDGLTYYWRVRPVNQAYLCHENFPTRSFVAVDGSLSTNLERLDFAENIRLFPNPIGQNKFVHLNLHIHEAQQLQVEIVNLLGKKVYSIPFLTSIGQNELQLPTADIPKGVYYVLVNADGKTWNSKLVIQ